MDDAQLQTVWQNRQFGPHFEHLSHPLAVFMKDTLARRVRRLSRLAAIWDEVIPDSIAGHTALESFHRGVLTVMVDSAAHRYRLQTLLTGGLMREIQARFPGSLDKIRLVPGQFCAVDVSGAPRYEL
jgi:predicted nucleic acid-binding Zn ribbon protein